MFQDNQFVIAQNSLLNLKDNGLSMIDVLVYCYLRSYMNNRTQKAVVGLATLEEKTTLSLKTIISSLSTLREKKFISFESIKNKTTTYSFPPIVEQFEQIPYILLYTTKLTAKEKAYMICVQRFIFNKNIFKDQMVDTLNNNSTVTINYTNFSPSQIAEKLGISKHTALNYVNSLSEKGFIKEIRYGANVHSREHRRWEFNYELLYEESTSVIVNLKAKIADTDEKLQLLTEENKALKIEVVSLKKQVQHLSHQLEYTQEVQNRKLLNN